ncbi:MAG: ribonuclease HII, partial [Alistipes sp.]|nr:ribonuclease HII [Candidatus Minthomonas equi]
FHHPSLNDSKQLSARKREELRPIIEENSLAWAVTEVSPAEIDEINILWASVAGMQRSIDRLPLRPELILVDGNRFRPYRDPISNSIIPHKCIVHGDALYASISAASILAKTYRDEYMKKMALEYPEYGWDRNMGYPTPEHRNAIERFGPSPLHRRTFRLLPDPTLF